MRYDGRSLSCGGTRWSAPLGRAGVVSAVVSCPARCAGLLVDVDPCRRSRESTVQSDFAAPSDATHVLRESYCQVATVFNRFAWLDTAPDALTVRQGSATAC